LRAILLGVFRTLIASRCSDQPPKREREPVIRLLQHADGVLGAGGPQLLEAGQRVVGASQSSSSTDPQPASAQKVLRAVSAAIFPDP